MTGNRHLVVAGASGVIGTAAVAHFARAPGWAVTALSRRRPIVPADAPFEHLSLDFSDREACATAVASLGPVSHVLYAAAREAPGLVAGWRDEALMAENGRMFANLIDPLAATGNLAHAVLLQGTKAYGAHRHDVAVPAREDRPRDEHPNFYWLHEDHAARLARDHGFAVTILRPQILSGTAPGVAMNPVLPIGAYAALCREMRLPFDCPAPRGALWEMMDAALFADAVHWAFDSSVARGQTFNITNGDVFVPADAWLELGSALGLVEGQPAPFSLAEMLAEQDFQSAWTALARREGLMIDDLSAFLGESHHYADLLLSPRIAEKKVPVLLSTIKLRQAGFAGCRDSFESLLDNLKQMVALKLLPPFPGLTERAAGTLA